MKGHEINSDDVLKDGSDDGVPLRLPFSAHSRIFNPYQTNLEPTLETNIGSHASTFRQLKKRAEKTIRTWSCLSCFGCCMPFTHTIMHWLKSSTIAPEVFPVQPPRDAYAPLSATNRRRITKLQEYLEENPGKIAKISMNISRRIKKFMDKKQMGMVLIGVATYIEILERTVDEACSYSFSYVNRELVSQPDALIDCLIRHHIPLFQALGIELLAVFITAQDEVENQITAIEALMQSVLSIMLGLHVAKSSKTNALSSEGGIHTITPTASDVAGIRTLNERIEIAGMRAIVAYIHLCQKLIILPDQLERLEECILSNIDLSSADVHEVIKGQMFPTSKILSRKANASELALFALKSFQPFLLDISIVYRVLDTLLSYLDKGLKWQYPAVVNGLLSLIDCASGNQTFPLFTSLVRHSSCPGLSDRIRSIIIQQAVSRGSPHSLSSINIALVELPRTLIAAGVVLQGSSLDLQGCHGDDYVNLSLDSLTNHNLLGYVRLAVRTLASKVVDTSQLFHALSGVLRQVSPAASMTPHDTKQIHFGVYILDLCLAALSVIKDSFISQQARLPHDMGLPSSLIQQLVQMIVNHRLWGDASDHVSDQALNALLLIITTVQSGPGSYPDERTACALVACSCSLAISPKAGPRQLEGASHLSAVAALSNLPSVHLQLSRFILALRAACFHEISNWGSVRVASVLLLSDCMMRQLAVTANCPNLCKLLVPNLEQSISVLQISQLKFRRPGMPHIHLPCLISSSNMFPTEQACSRASEEALRAGHSGWAVAYVKCLQTDGVLSKEFATSLPKIMSEAIDIGIYTSSLLSFTGPSLNVTRAVSGDADLTEVSFFRPSDASSVLTVPSFMSSIEMSTLISQTQSLPERVEAASWGLREFSIIKRDEANFSEVMALVNETVMHAEGQSKAYADINDNGRGSLLQEQEILIVAQDQRRRRTHLAAASISEVIDIVERATKLHPVEIQQEIRR